MAQKIAVIDLGTNTFHLLIVEIQKSHQSWKEIYRERRYIHLAESGIETIGNAAFERGFEALISFSQICKAQKVTKIKACGTAALRTASNGPLFVEKILEFCNLQIDIIDGISEAKFISQGVQLALPNSNAPRLIMDIGGGSVEFILIRNHELIWSQSFKIGVAVLKKAFHNSDPIASSELNELNQFLSEELKTLEAVLDNESELDLVGASGTFDVLQQMISQKDSGENYSQLNLEEFNPLAVQLIKMKQSERDLFPNLPIERSQLIVVALVLIQHVLKLHAFQNLYVSRFAMKEGILTSMPKS